MRIEEIHGPSVRRYWAVIVDHRITSSGEHNYSIECFDSLLTMQVYVSSIHGRKEYFAVEATPMIFHSEVILSLTLGEDH